MENGVKHTPGPWLWHWAEDLKGYADGRVHTDPKNNVITGHAVCVAVSPRLQSKEQWEADARLIAAAPDLFEALTELHCLLDFEESGSDDKPWIFEDWSGINAAFEKAYTALQKAKGRA